MGMTFCDANKVVLLETEFMDHEEYREDKDVECREFALTEGERIVCVKAEHGSKNHAYLYNIQFLIGFPF